MTELPFTELQDDLHLAFDPRAGFALLELRAPRRARGPDLRRRASHLAVDGGTRLFAAPGGRPVAIAPGYRVTALTMCGPTLLALLTKQRGEGARRVVGLDPQSLAVTFDLGEWGSAPDDDWTLQICSNGRVAVAVRSRSGGENDSEVIAFDPGGRLLWSLPVGTWSGHWFMGGYVVVLSSRGWNIVRPDNGEVVAQYGTEDE